jgi:23S rRNA A2030 N6-methylase RlmJ
MLSYLHAFHAGNFADVQKHTALTLALSMMQAKPSAIACFDTHAGSAIYDLESERARKTAEADAGVQKLWACRSGLHSEDWQPVMEVLSRFNAGEGRLTVYKDPAKSLAEMPPRGLSCVVSDTYQRLAGDIKTGCYRQPHSQSVVQ